MRHLMIRDKEFVALVKQEREQYKQRRKAEYMGTEIIIYGLAGLCVFMCIVLGSHVEGKERIDLWYFFMPTMVLSMLYRCIYSVKENNKQENIFEKYTCIPVQGKKLLYAKVYLVFCGILKFTIACQVMACLGRYLDIRYGGTTVICEVSLFQPFLWGVVMIIVYVGHIVHLYYKARK